MHYLTEAGRKLGGNVRTLSRERDGLASVGDGGDLMDTEPDRSTTVPSRDISRGLGHVDVRGLQGH